MPDHQRMPALALLFGLLVFFVGGFDLVAGIATAVLVLLAHISDQLAYLIRQREPDTTSSL